MKILKILTIIFIILSLINEINGTELYQFIQKNNYWVRLVWGFISIQALGLPFLYKINMNVNEKIRKRQTVELYPLGKVV